MKRASLIFVAVMLVLGLLCVGTVCGQAYVLPAIRLSPILTLRRTPEPQLTLGSHSLKMLA